MAPTLIPLPSCRTSGAAPHAVPGLRRVPVLHRGLLTIAACPAPFARIDAPVQRPAVAKRGLSTRHATRPTPVSDRWSVTAITSLTRMVRAAMEPLEPVTESGPTAASSLSSPAPKAIATFSGPWITRHPGNKERAGSSASIAVGADGSYPVIQESAYRETPKTGTNNPLPMLGAALVGRSHRARVSIIPRRWAGTINQPLKDAHDVSQTESVANQMATTVRSLRRRYVRVVSRDGVIDAEEAAIDQVLIQLGDELEQKAEDERGAIALIRTGRTKRTRGIVTDLFPSIGPDAA